MIKVSLYGDPPQKAKDYAQLLEIRQVSEPFCERLDNNKDIDASQINTDDEEKFVRSLVDIGQAEIFE